MRKTAVVLLAACLLSAFPIAGYAAGITQEADGTVITAQVPSVHTLSVEAENAAVTYHDETGTSFEVPRLDEFTLTVSAADGYVITGVYLDGEDVTSSLYGSTLTLSGICRAVKLTVTTGEVSGTTEFRGVLYDLPEQELPDEDLLYKIAVEVSGLYEVPEAFAGNKELNTVEKISDVLKTVLIGQCGYPEENVVIYEVTLVVSADGGETWETAETGHFPEDGLEVILPYPEGTAKDTQDFAAAHMFTSTAFGKKPGDTENPAVTKTDDGLQMKLTGLSPVAIAWDEVSTETAASATETTEAGGISGTSGNTAASGTSGASETTTASGTGGSAKTGDAGSLVFWITLSVACGLVFLAGRRVLKQKN